MNIREETHNLKNYQPSGPIDALFPGTYYLEAVDDKFRRKYNRVPLTMNAKNGA
jgi:hydroxymethylglutaryl-CoA synthase